MSEIGIPTNLKPNVPMSTRAAKKADWNFRVLSAFAPPHLVDEARRRRQEREMSIDIVKPTSLLTAETEDDAAS